MLFSVIPAKGPYRTLTIVISTAGRDLCCNQNWHLRISHRLRRVRNESI